MNLPRRSPARRRHDRRDRSPVYRGRRASAYTRFFHHYEGAPLVIVNAAEIDFAHKDDDYGLLFDKLRSISSGRHYLNPLPF